MSILFIVSLCLLLGTVLSDTCKDSLSVNPPTACPTWQYKKDGSCQCPYKYQTKYISCSSNTDSNHSQLTLEQKDYCITYNNTSNLTFIGKCPYNTVWSKSPFIYITPNVLEVNEEICGPLNRTGLLCSQCQPGLGPAVFSYYRECRECLAQPLGWFLFFVRLTVPLTLFCVIVIVFQINIASPALNGFVITVQIITNVFNNFPFEVHGFEHHYSIVKFVADVYGIFSLDFFTYAIPSFCISEGMSMLTVLSLQYIEAVYPILFTLSVYIFITLHDEGYRIVVFCWRPFHKCLARFRRNWKLKGSVINAFATFLLLSSSKFCSISVHLIQPVDVWDICGGRTYQVYFEASYRAFSKKHIPYLVLAVSFIFFFIVLPAIFISFYQNKLFQKCLSVCRFRCFLVHELANTIQGCFKNGTEPGTRDYRWFAGAYLLLRVFLVFFINLQFSELLYIIAPVGASFFLLTLRPYRVDWCNNLDAFLWLSISVGTSWRVYWVAFNAAWRQFPDILRLLPLLYILCYILYSAFKHFRSLYRQRRNLQRTAEREDEEIPHRLLHPNQYDPLLPKRADILVNS